MDRISPDMTQEYPGYVLDARGARIRAPERRGTVPGS